MEMEANWMIQAQGPVLLVRLAMRILMQVLRLKNCIFEKTELSPLEALIYTQPKQRDTLRIIPVVTSYMSNIFDRMLPILSCRLLRRIALEYNMSLLACLDMEADQIRLTFLNSLPDELESDALKISILELVEACIEKQPGVTEAFFKVNFGKETRIFASNNDNVQITDSILTYMEDYLEAVSKAPNTLAHTLPSKIMSIFHSLWMNNMQLLVDELVKKPKFWEKLCKPLFVKDFAKLKQVRAYAQLFNILAMEMFYTTAKANVELKDVLTKLFTNENLTVLLQFMFNLPKEPISSNVELSDYYSEDQPDWLCRLQAFKGFLMVLLKKRPVFLDIPQSGLKMLAEQCLQALVARAEYVDDLRPFIILAEMYLIILQSFKHSYTENASEDRQMLQSIIKLLEHVAGCYEDLHVRAKDANLAIAIKCADLLVEQLLQDASASLNFLYSVVHIICVELEHMETCLQLEAQNSKTIDTNRTSSTNTVILSLNLLKTVATIFHKEGPNNWDAPFKTHKVFQRLLSCTSQILPLHTKQNLTVELLDVLNIFAKGNCSSEFLYCDVSDYLWLKLLPPKELLQQTNFVASTNKQNDAWQVHQWWTIYARGIDLVTTLCQQHEHLFVKESLQFVGIHHDYLIDCLLLGKQSLEPQAIQLIKSAVTLLQALMPYAQQWRIDHAESLYSTMRAVQLLMGFTISMFHQPKSLKILVAGRRLNTELLAGDNDVELVDEMISTLNDLTEILILCAKCLQQFSPPLLELLCAPELSLSQYECIFEVSFGAPKISAQAVTISFGTVLSIVSVFTKALNLQNYAFQEVPLNTLPAQEDTADGSVSKNGKNGNNVNQSCNSTMRPFSKSMSVTSVSSVNAPANELLANLDSELCLMALEHVLTLAATQSILTLKNNKLPQREKALIRREISSELIYLHEFVRKKVLVDYREHKSMWQRRKMGQVLMSATSAYEAGAGAVNLSARSVDTRRPVADLRINVVRRLHLQQQQQSRSPFEMTSEISPIGASTPHLQQPPMRRRSTNQAEDNPKRLYPNMDFEQTEEEEEEIEMLQPEEPKYSPLSYVQFIEEDHLHFLSNLFMVICQSD